MRASELEGGYRKAADQGFAKAQFNLGVCYKKGQGVPQSFKEAVRWCRKAADQGLANAQGFMGMSFEHGQGVEQSLDEALKWYRLAAAQGGQHAFDEDVTRVEAALILSTRPPTAMPLERVCANCSISSNNEGVKLNACSRCKVVKYCSRACQLKHWKEGGHRKICSE